MKKWIAAALALVMVFCLAACGNRSEIPVRAKDSEFGDLFRYTLNSKSGNLDIQCINKKYAQTWGSRVENWSWNTHYLMPFRDFSNGKLAPVYVFYDAHFDYVDEGAVLALSPQVRSGKVKSADVTLYDWGEDSTPVPYTTHYQFFIQGLTIQVTSRSEVDTENQTETIQMNPDGTVAALESYGGQLTFTYSNGILKNVQSDGIIIQDLKINEKGQITSLSSSGGMMGVQLSASYDRKGLLKEESYEMSGGDSATNYREQYDTLILTKGGQISSVAYKGSYQSSILEDAEVGTTHTEKGSIHCTLSFEY